MTHADMLHCQDLRDGGTDANAPHLPLLRRDPGCTPDSNIVSKGGPDKRKQHRVIAADAKSDRPAVTLGEIARGDKARCATSTMPFWWRDAPPAAGSQELPPATADVLVVGSGFTGLSAALVLARSGRNVVVVDANAPGYGASTRNGGQVGSGNQKFRVKTLIGMVGESKAVALLREGVEMLDGIEPLIRDEKIDCHFERCGRFRGAMRPQHYEAMARDMEDLKRYAGVESFVVSRSERCREIGTDLFHGGSVLPMDASLHPRAYHAGLMARVLEAGGRVHGNAAVRAINPEREGYSVKLKDRTIRARDVLVATNGYTNGVGGYFRKRIVPVISAQIATGPIDPHLLDTLMPKRRVYGNTNRVFFYFRCAPGENRLIWGGRAAHVAPETSFAAYAHLARDLLRAFPSLGDVQVSHAWSGTIGYTFDEFPHLGRAPTGVYYAMGYCGTGVSRATHFGRKIALQMLDKAEGGSAFDDIAFPSHVFHAFARPAVPFYEGWYRFRDATGF
jgi:glycine/D-amino acid oxidase-like deaminating enzyme